MEMPPIRYASSRDGTAIAYTVLPGESPPWFHIYSLTAPGIELDLAIPSRRGFIDELANGRATVLYDPRGRGFSGPLAGPVTMDDMVDDIDAVTLAVGEPMDVMAANTGAYAACIYAASQPELWRSMLLLAASVRWADSLDASGWALLPDHKAGIRYALRTAMDVSFDELGSLVERAAAAMPSETGAAYRAALVNVDLSDVLPRIELETIVAARSGTAISPAAVEVASLIPRARLVATEDGYHRPKTARQLREAIESGDHAPKPAGEAKDGLSPREHDVLRLLAAGKSNRQIAEALVLSEATVATHVRHILEKTGSANRAEATGWAVRNGLA